MTGRDPAVATTGLIAAPDLELIESGVHLKVWIMSVIRGLTKGVKSEPDDVIQGTHHVMVELSDEANNNDLMQVDIKVDIVSPSGKKSMVELQDMFRQYGGSIRMDEKGEYNLDVNVIAGGREVTGRLTYKVV